jgi:undecaprenyl diphosphate synthase
MDGNGRWAEKWGLSRLKGHEAGVENLRSVVEYLNEYRINYVTVYSFSTENWTRPEEEVAGLLKLLEDRIDAEALQLHKKGVRLRHLGRLNGLSDSVKLAVNRVVELTRNNTGMTLSFAFNYGGRGEILDAVHRLILDGTPPQNIDEELFNSYLYTAGLPDVDLLVRTGGEFRISNFLMWQAAYSEFYFTRVLWPDFGKRDVDKALRAYSRRQRRFGGL